MKVSYVSFSKKAQLKIQQMAFMLVAVFIFFSLAGIFYLNFSSGDLENRIAQLREEEAIEIVSSISKTPEFSFFSTGECSSCIDLDKVLLLKERQEYKDFWNIDFLMVEKVWPNATNKECTRANYPECNKITLISANDKNIRTRTSYVTIARWDPSLGSRGSYRYEIGKVHISAKNIEND